MTSGLRKAAVLLMSLPQDEAAVGAEQAQAQADRSRVD